MATYAKTAKPERVKGRDWTLEERKLAFYLYCQLPFGKLHHRNPQVIELARVLERKPSSVAMKLTNFASLDPAIVASGRKGLRGAASGDREVWELFHRDWDGLLGEAQRLLLQRDPALASQIDVVAEEPSMPDGVDYSSENRPALTQQRVGQETFRRMVMGIYDGRCCMSGVSFPELLVASHIVPWSADAKNRLNPRNGLCLSALHDRAFDQYLLSLDDQFCVVLSRKLKKRCKDDVSRKVFLAIESKPIDLPRRFQPDRELVAQHRAEFVARNG